MNRVVLGVFAAAFVGLAALAGCGGSSVDPALVAEHRTRLELAEEPHGAQTVLQVRQVMYGEDAATAPEHEHAEDHGHAHAEASEHAHEHHHADEHGHGEEAEDAEAHEQEESREHADTAEEAVHKTAGADEPDGHNDHADEKHGASEHADHDHEADEPTEHDHGAHEHADHAHEQEHEHEHEAENANAGAAEAKKPVRSEMDVVMVGSVGGIPNPSEQSHPEFPFAKGMAVFFLADAGAVAEMEEHAHHHAPGEECSFCAAHAGESAHLMAVVQFSDEKGKPLPIDARDLFKLKEKETVVVRGKAKIDPAGLLTVNATGLYVRR